MRGSEGVGGSGARAIEKRKTEIAIEEPCSAGSGRLWRALESTGPSSVAAGTRGVRAPAPPSIFPLRSVKFNKLRGDGARIVPKKKQRVAKFEPGIELLQKR